MADSFPAPRATEGSLAPLRQAGWVGCESVDVGAIFAADRPALAAGIELLTAGLGSAQTALTVRPDQLTPFSRETGFRDGSLFNPRRPGVL